MKWLINYSYNPRKNSIKNHLEIISRTLDTFTTKYENILILGDFNACADDETMKNFCSSYGLYSLVKQPTCYKNPENSSCVDLILTNKAKSFQSTCAMETGLSNFHRMTISVLKMHFLKLSPKVIRYRDFKNFENERFMNSLQSALNNQNGDYIKNPEVFFNICHEVLNKHAPRKKKYIRGNNKPFMTKALSKAIMQRTCLRNKFLKNPTNQNRLSYKKQIKFCLSLLIKEKKEYFANLNEKDITNNRKFWYTVKPFLSDKIKSRENIILINNERIMSDEVEIANTLNDFFSNIIKNLKLLEYYVEEKISHGLSSHPTLKAILKYKNHPSMKVIKSFSTRFSSFYLSHVDKNIVLKEIRKLKMNKAVQDTGIPVKTLRWLAWLI